ncbi:hypothetical protein Tco_1399638 [Tanacetum coccineum]
MGRFRVLVMELKSETMASMNGLEILVEVGGWAAVLGAEWISGGPRREVAVGAICDKKMVLLKYEVELK